MMVHPKNDGDITKTLMAYSKILTTKGQLVIKMYFCRGHIASFLL